LRTSLIFAPVALVAQAACTSPDMAMNPAYAGDTILNAVAYINLNEREDREEIKAFIGVDPVHTEWCAAFLNAVLEESGMPSPNTLNHEFPLTARTYLKWGREVDYPLPGDVVIFPRGTQGWQGHVGIFLEPREINGVVYYMILGGNQNNTVSIKAFEASRALGIRRWTGTRI